MFLHSGASLHGHEYSNRSSSSSSSFSPLPPSNAAPQRRNHLLRSALAATPRNRNRASIGSTVPFSEAALAQLPSPPSPPAPATPSTAGRTRARPVSDYIPRVRTGTVAPSSEPVVRFKEPEHDYFHVPATPSTLSDAMSEDEGSVVEVSDSDVNQSVSSAGRGPRRRRAPRKSTTYLLAQPAPKLRHKQRLMHIRPKLFLQMQHLSADGRPKPVVDVYPSSAFAKTLVAPLLKRFPLISRTKSELSVQDVMLVRAEDYSAQGSELDSDGDDDHSNIKSRDLVAVLSPLRNEDKAEIVLTDGTVWVATPRYNGSYDFHSVNACGKTITARWVRKQVVTNTRSLPTSPTLSIPPSSKTSSTSSVDYKYTFSIIDPNSRRHPIMATLTNSSLDILDSYVTVSQSSNRYPPTSEDVRTERTSQPVEEWQKCFISVSAIWVALRQGWAPNCRPTDIISPTVLNSAPSKRDSWSSAATHDPASPKSSMQETRTRRQFLPLARPHQELSTPTSTPTSASTLEALPRRATSTGAAFMAKRRAMTRANSDYTTTTTTTSSTTSSGRDSGSFCKVGARRAFSGDWESKWRAQQQQGDKSLAAMVNKDSTTSSSKSQGSGSTLALTSIPPCSLLATSPDQATAPSDPLMDAMVDESVDGCDRGKNHHHHHHHHRLRHMVGWFRKLGTT